MKPILQVLPLLLTTFLFIGCGKSADGIVAELQKAGIEGEVTNRIKSSSNKYKIRLTYEKEGSHKVWIYEFRSPEEATTFQNGANGKVQMDKIGNIRASATRHFIGKFGIAVTKGEEAKVLEVVKQYAEE